MKTSYSLARLSVLCATLLFGAVVPATVHANTVQYYAYVRHLLKNDLRSIPAGTPATDAQKSALSADLDKLFFYSYPLPTVTIDFLADQLADAVSTAAFAPEDVTAVTDELISILDQSTTVHPKRIAALQATLAKARVDSAMVAQIVAALTALPDSFGYNSVYVSLGTDLSIINPRTPGYKHASGNISLVHYVRPTFDRDDNVTDPALLQRNLSVQVERLPLGRYHVNAITSSGGAPVELGTFGVHSTDPQVTEADPVGTDPTGTVQASGERFGDVTFSDSGYGKPLPAGVSLDSITGVTITDAQGVVQFTGSLAASAGAVTTRSVNLHLQATAAAPTVGGKIYFMNIDGFNPDRNFTFSAVGLPVNATLTLSVDDKAVGPVTTGPTGNLYVKEYSSYFYPSPGITEIVQLLPDTVDLAVAKTFTLSDAQGNVLASAEVPTASMTAP